MTLTAIFLKYSQKTELSNVKIFFNISNINNTKLKYLKAALQNQIERK